MKQDNLVNDNFWWLNSKGEYKLVPAQCGDLIPVLFILTNDLKKWHIIEKDE